MAAVEAALTAAECAITVGTDKDAGRHYIAVSRGNLQVAARILSHLGLVEAADRARRIAMGADVPTIDQQASAAAGYSAGPRAGA